MRTQRIVLPVVASLGILGLAGYVLLRPAKPGAAIPVEEVADRLVSEAVLFGACPGGDNLTMVAGLAGRLDLPLEERLGRAWKCNGFLELAGESRLGSAAIAQTVDTMSSVMASVSRDFVTAEEAKVPKLARSLGSKIRFAATEKSQRKELGNPQLYRETILEKEKAFNQSIDEEAARVLVQRQARLSPLVLDPIRPKLPKFRQRLIRVLQSDPELLASLREAMALERVVPADLRESRERADGIIARARQSR